MLTAPFWRPTPLRAARRNGSAFELVAACLFRRCRRGLPAGEAMWRQRLAFAELPLGPHDAIFEIVSVEWAGTARPAPLGNGSPCAAGNGLRCAVAHSEPLPGARLMPTGSVVAVAALASTGSSKQDTLARVPQRVTLAFLPWWSGAPSYQSTFELRRRNQRRAET